MGELYERHFEHPPPRDPVLLLCLEGWVDAGGAAHAVAEHLRERADQHLVATFDADRLLDHRARRPVMRLEDGVITAMSWPGIELVALRDDRGRDVLLLHGAEPDHEWYGFIEDTIELCEDLGVTMVVGLGAYPAAAPHTRPTRLSCTAATAALATRLPFERATLEIPAGVQSVIEHEAAMQDIPAIGLWAQVPHYAAAMPYPAASARLVEGLHEVAELDFDVAGLDRDAEATTTRLNELVADSAEHQELVRELERHVDADTGEESDDGEIEFRSGDELAEEFERFLREQGD